MCYTYNMNAISIKNLTKKYGSILAVDDISLDVAEADFFGFIGPNGAGKTTTIKTLLGLLRANSGEIKIFGESIQKNNFQQYIGLVPGEANLYGNLKVGEQIAYFARYYEDIDSKYLSRLKEMFELKVDKKISDLSLGNKKKIAIVCALMNKPKLLVFDEVSNSLDPLMQKVLFDELARLNNNGTTIFFSSHNLEEVQTFCKNVAIIRSGKIIETDNVKKIVASVGLQVTIKTKKSIDQAFFVRHKIDCNKNGNNSMSFVYKVDINELISMVSKYKLESIRISDVKLEDIFGEFYEKEE